jgi:hypothetical protein
VPEVTRLVAEARAMLREALDAMDDLPAELELADVERCLYAVEERLVLLSHSVGDG